jgi:two-component system, NtrC family, nitrogen regulation response regulator GlnG
MAEAHINYKILLVDDDPRFHKDFREVFCIRPYSYEVESVKSAEDMWSILKKNSNYDLILLDLKLDGESVSSGMNLIPLLLKHYNSIPIIVITADKRAQTAEDAMKQGAKSFIQKSNNDFVYWNQRIAETIQNSKAPQKIDEAKRYPFVGRAPRIRELKTFLKILAQKPDVTLLITGETGVGKEVAARYLHSCGPRANKPFVAVNLSSIQKTLLESTLFGSVKGAFTDAKDVEGYFQQANGGVLLLDEIGDIDHEIQVKLLRFLEQRTIRPVGSPKDIELDIHILTATKKNIDELVRQELFREDLRFRMNITVDIPPLRERMQDVEPILEFYLNKKYPGLGGLSVLESAVLQRINNYHWPGNVRQLSSTVDGMMTRRDLYNLDKVNMFCFEDSLKTTSGALLSNNNVINIAAVSVPVSTSATVTSIVRNRKEQQTYEDLQRIEETLRRNRGRKEHTAEDLGFKGTDHLRARIVTCYKNYPLLFEEFPIIMENYKSALVEKEKKK